MMSLEGRCFRRHKAYRGHVQRPRAATPRSVTDLSSISTDPVPAINQRLSTSATRVGADRPSELPTAHSSITNGRLGLFRLDCLFRGVFQQWEHDLRVAIEATERLLALQEDFNQSHANMPEALQESARGAYYEEVINVDLGAVDSKCLWSTVAIVPRADSLPS
jgi:hypothetical protein